jgi:hypothetical protein
MNTKTGLIAFLTLACGLLIVCATEAQPGDKQATADRRATSNRSNDRNWRQ